MTLLERDGWFSGLLNRFRLLGVVPPENGVQKLEESHPGAPARTRIVYKGLVPRGAPDFMKTFVKLDGAEYHVVVTFARGERDNRKEGVLMAATHEIFTVDPPRGWPHDNDHDYFYFEGWSGKLAALPREHGNGWFCYEEKLAKGCYHLTTLGFTVGQITDAVSAGMGTGGAL